RTIVSFKPNSFGERRLHTIILVALDTGLRIEECLTLTRSKVDFDNLVLTVKGKVNKARIVPFSQELRKVLYRWCRHHESELVFSTRHGGKVSYHNLNRDYRKLCEKLKIEKEGSFHRLRHTFALQYVRNGGGLFHLQKQLGHT